METIRFKLTGTSPLLVQADVLANPIHPLTKAHKVVSAKKKKTEDDHLWLMQSEWKASMYHDDQIGPYLPAVNLEGSIVEAAKITRMGSTLKQAVQVLEDKVKLDYTGPRDKEAMWAAGTFSDVRGVNVSGRKIMRCRPTFPSWSARFTLSFMEDVVDADVLAQIVETAGRRIGVGTFRPRFGRFSAEVVQ